MSAAGTQDAKRNRSLLALRKERRARELLLGPDIAGSDCAWNILIELTQTRIDAGRVSVSGACAMPRHALTTSLRCIGKLEAAGLLERERSHDDGRRFWLKLSQVGWDQMAAYLDRLAPQQHEAVSSQQIDFSGVVDLARNHGIIGHRYAEILHGSQAGVGGV